MLARTAQDTWADVRRQRPRDPKLGRLVDRSRCHLEGVARVFERIAVVNRGEPAMRLIRAVRELNEEHGYGIRVIAMHTEDERHATFVRAADESVVLRDTGKGIAYLDHDELARALRESRG